MSERRLRIAAKARQDLLSIGRYTQERWGMSKRRDYLAQLDSAIQAIARDPEIGRRCDDVRAGYRKLAQGSHIIYYRIGDGVEVIRILHRRMDPDTQFASG